MLKDEIIELFTSMFPEIEQKQDDKDTWFVHKCVDLIVIGEQGWGYEVDDIVCQYVDNDSPIQVHFSSIEEAKREFEYINSNVC